MAWVNVSDRNPPKEGDYKVIMRRTPSTTYESVAAFIPTDRANRRRMGAWYSTTSGTKLSNVIAWCEEEKA